jgi:Na+/melibiose symporter and related transporters
MTKLAYTIIIFGSSTLWGVVNGWLLYFYLPPGASPLIPLASYSLIILVSKAINIAIGLPIGYISDHTSSSWGRRLPYIIGGAILMPVLFVLLWTPPHDKGPTLTFLYLFLVLVAFNLAFQVHLIPYDSLLPELVVGEKERVTISTWKAGFLLGGSILAGFTGPLISSMGYVRSMWTFAIVVAPILILPGFFLRKQVNLKYQAIRQTSFLTSLKATFRNRNFQVFASAWIPLWTASILIIQTMPFIVTEVCRLTEAQAAYFYLSGIAITLIAFPFINRLSERYSIKAVYRSSLLAGAISLPSLMLIGDWIPVPLLAQGIVWVVLQGASLAGTQILPNAIIAEIIDNDEQLTKQRREGSFYSVWGVLNQVSSGLATAIVPLFLLVGRSKFDPQGPLGVRLLGLFGGFLLLISFWGFHQYKPEKSEGEQTKSLSVKVGEL